MKSWFLHYYVEELDAYYLDFEVISKYPRFNKCFFFVSHNLHNL